MKDLNEIKNLVEFVSELTHITGCMAGENGDVEKYWFYDEDLTTKKELFLDINNKTLIMSSGNHTSEFDRKTFLAVSYLCEIYDLTFDLFLSDD